jgi:predicted nucleic acid-binding protein
MLQAGDLQVREDAPRAFGEERIFIGAIGNERRRQCDGRLVRMTVKWPDAFRATLKLSGRHAAKTGTRSLDILHIASAKALRVNELATFDSRQLALAAAAGLTAAV